MCAWPETSRTTSNLCQHWCTNCLSCRRTALQPSYYMSSGSCCTQLTMSALSVRIILACGATCLDAFRTLWKFLCQAVFKSSCISFRVPIFTCSQIHWPAADNSDSVRNFRELSALKPDSPLVAAAEAYDEIDEGSDGVMRDTKHNASTCVFSFQSDFVFCVVCLVAISSP